MTLLLFIAQKYDIEVPRYAIMDADVARQANADIAQSTRQAPSTPTLQQFDNG